MTPVSVKRVVTGSLFRYRSWNVPEAFLKVTYLARQLAPGGVVYILGFAQNNMDHKRSYNASSGCLLHTP